MSQPLEEPAGAHRRRHPRVPCGRPALLATPDGEVRGLCRELSIGGMFFVGPTPAVGQRVRVILNLPSGEVEARGVVRYRHAGADSSGVGIRFDAIPPSTWRTLERYAARRSVTPPSERDRE